jgi:hypothetical protein|tara:strand:- start:2037 stop:3671 length:1635 start_codon:yes stop_codon:yes gene_type:complete
MFNKKSYEMNPTSPPARWSEIKERTRKLGPELGLSSNLLALLDVADKIVWYPSGPPGKPNALAWVTNENVDGNSKPDSINFNVNKWSSSDINIDDLVREFVITLGHEGAHLTSYDSATGKFVGDEGPAEAEEQRIMNKLKSMSTNKYNRNQIYGDNMSINNELVSMANRLDAAGHNDLSDRIDRLIKGAAPVPAENTVENTFMDTHTGAGDQPELTVEEQRVSLWRDRLTALRQKVDERPRYFGRRRDLAQIDTLRDALEPYDRAAARGAGINRALMEDDDLFLDYLNITGPPNLPDVDLVMPDPEPSQYARLFEDRGDISSGGEAVTLEGTEYERAYNREYVDPLITKDDDMLINHHDWQYQVMEPTEESYATLEDAQNAFSFRVVTVPPGYRRSRYYIVTKDGAESAHTRLIIEFMDHPYWGDYIRGLVSDGSNQGNDIHREPPVGQGDQSVRRYRVISKDGPWYKDVGLDGTVEYFDASGNQATGSSTLHLEEGNTNIQDPGVAWLEIEADEADDGHMKDATLNDLASNFTFGMNHPTFRR